LWKSMHTNARELPIPQGGIWGSCFPLAVNQDFYALFENTYSEKLRNRPV
jgi:hypothetical protein